MEWTYLLKGGVDVVWCDEWQTACALCSMCGVHMRAERPMTGIEAMPPQTTFADKSTKLDSANVCRSSLAMHTAQAHRPLKHDLL